jgi:hypothetical protein
MAAFMVKINPTSNQFSLPRAGLKKRASSRQLLAGFLGLVLFVLPLCLPRPCLATGVTIITHGFELGSSYPDWVTGMADQIPHYQSFPGTNFTTYRIAVTYTNGYYIAWRRTNGSPPSVAIQVRSLSSLTGASCLVTSLVLLTPAPTAWRGL